MDILSIERVWEDNDFFEIEVVAQAKLIKAIVRSYTTEALITKLASKLMTFPNNLADRFLWENGEKGDDSTPFLSLEFWCDGNCGHVTIEVYMEIDDGGHYSKHNSCFYISTEIGLLNSFGKKLISLTKKGVGRKVNLN